MVGLGRCFGELSELTKDGAFTDAAAGDFERDAESPMRFAEDEDAGRQDPSSLGRELVLPGHPLHRCRRQRLQCAAQVFLAEALAGDPA